ncbi:MAG: hypothetical protein KDA84_05435 [Planctomycetaceae bacterium]|nr:hypothetical protein [Planctomycetaceae bacterium]
MSRNDQYITGQTPLTNSTPITDEEEPFFVEIEETSSPTSQPTPPPTMTIDEAEAPPQWFNGSAKQQKTASKPRPATGRNRQQAASQPKRKKPVRRAPIVAADEEDPEELTWQEQFRRWVHEGGGAGFGVSVLVHAVLLLTLSLLILHQPEDEELITTVGQSEAPDLASIKDVDLDVDLKPEIQEQIKNPEFEPQPLSMPNLGIGSLASSLDSPNAGGLDFKIPSQAVTKGSFTVWTEPEDPKPREDYWIMIKIKLKNDLRKYPRRDLMGKVMGTDGYEKNFGGPTESGYEQVNKSMVIMKACKIPGALQELVKDTITVHSKMLNEKQTIELVF